MIKNDMFVTSITRYYNYIERPNIWYKTPVATLSGVRLLELSRMHYQYSGNFLYEIEVKQ